MMRLKNKRRETFAHALAAGKSGTDSYLLAGYSVSRKVAAACACRLLKKAQIRARIDELRDEADTLADVTLPRTMQGLAQAGFSNMLDYVRVDDEGRPIPNLAAVTRAQAAGIGDIRVERFKGRGQYARPVQRTIIKLPDKTRALAKLANLLSNPKASA